MILLAEELTATTHDIKIRNTNKTVHVMNDKKGIWTAKPEPFNLHNSLLEQTEKDN